MGDPEIRPDEAAAGEDSTPSGRGCSFCGGTGSVAKYQCLVCEGSGVVAALDSDVNCPHCNGTGCSDERPVLAAYPNLCPPCGGTGYVRQASIEFSKTASPVDRD
jgi:DnaJ-class molecular chaperone